MILRKPSNVSCNSLEGFHPNLCCVWMNEQQHLHSLQLSHRHSHLRMRNKHACKFQIHKSFTNTSKIDRAMHICAMQPGILQNNMLVCKHAGNALVHKYAHVQDSQNMVIYRYLNSIYWSLEWINSAWMAAADVESMFNNPLIIN